MFSLSEDEDTACRQLVGALQPALYDFDCRQSLQFCLYGCRQVDDSTPKVEVADTVGAGDSFSGAFVYSILAGKSLREAHQTAVGTAAFVCTKEGAWPAYPI